MKDLSITIVAYNNYLDIVNALNSMYENVPSKINKQVFIVDNSADNSSKNQERECLLRLIEAKEDVAYINAGSNLGFGRGHNYVIPFLDSEFHAIVNPDIVFVEDPFSSMMEYMEKEKIGMCIPKLVDEEGNIQAVYRRELTVCDMFIRMFCKGVFNKRKAYHTMQDMDYSKPFQVPFGQGSFLVIRTELFKILDGFDDKYFMYVEDADLCKRVNQVSKFMYYPNAKVIHRWEKASHKDGKLLVCHIKSMIYYFKKWGVKMK